MRQARAACLVCSGTLSQIAPFASCMAGRCLASDDRHRWASPGYLAAWKEQGEAQTLAADGRCGRAAYGGRPALGQQHQASRAAIPSAAGRPPS